MGKRGVKPTLRLTLPKHVQEVIVREKITLNTMGRRKKKYTDVQLIRFREGYDLLETLYIVRIYIESKYGVNIRILEILLAFYGKKLFTYLDYKDMPRVHGYCAFTLLLREGYFVMVIKQKTREKSVYRLTRKASEIVEEFYELLSGEREYPQELKDKFKKKTPYDKIKGSLIKKLNDSQKDIKKGYFE